ENVLYSHTESWKRHRRIINSCFHKEINVNKYEKSVKRLMIHLKKSRNKSIDVHDLISKTTLDILGNTIMGFDLNCLDIEEGEYSKAYNLAAAGVSKDIYFFFPILEKLNLESRIREREAVHKFRGLVQYLIKFKKLQMSNNPNKQEEEDKVDMLSLMIEATMQEEVHKRLTDDELINNIVVMFAAGHDTTANTLSFTLYHLAKNQHIQDKARKEILEHFNGDSKYPTMDMVKEMNYVEAIIYESMRVTPTLPQIRRKLINDYSCNDGTYLPKGTNIILQSYSIMNDPNIWEEPSTFLPDRFLQNNQINKAKMNNWYGFGGGSRICIGQNLSIIEQKILMMCILSKFKITL
ncbi:cytochrome P450, partial [Neoconidiobolus thromboides FSU 785]